MSAVSGLLPPVRIGIQGRFWDSQIYSGELYLFGRDGSIYTVDWKNFVASLLVPNELRIVTDAALLGSRDFYSPSVLRVIQDPEVQPVMLNKFRKLEQLTSQWQIDASPFMHRRDNPFPFPHNDTDVHYGSLFVGSRSGIFGMAGHAFKSRGSTARKLTDLPTLDIATKYSSIAAAGGSEGLFEITSRRHSAQPVSRIAPNICSTCEWSYASIVGSDQGHALFVAKFELVPEETQNQRNRKRKRSFAGVASDVELFSSPQHSGASIEWGAKDRLYRFSDGQFDAVENTSNGTVSFRQAEQPVAKVDFDLDEFVSVRVAPFGSVFEFDSHISVILNTGESLKFQGEPVSWRVYPRSLNYLNHLHVIYEDRIEIIAFTSDYFVRSEERRFGTEPISADERIASR